MYKTWYIIFSVLWLGLIFSPQQAFSCEPVTEHMPASSSSCNSDRNSKSQKSCCDDQQKHHETKDCDQKCSGQICHIPAKVNLSASSQLTFNPQLFDISNSVFWKNDMSILSVVLSIWQPPRLV
ncbi:hypothetical protein ACR777_20575 [Sphingobacterium spiritivorum]|uniref:hypothetical protein n=1 Tax=Sphingobacterium spiritivorum TaxID=258 RepID=UPI003DA2DF5A